MHPKNLSISGFLYELPEDRIAKYPLAERDASKLLVYKNGLITKSDYLHLHEFLPEETLLVFNNTKVVEARILFQKPTGGVIEIFCLEPGDEYGDITAAMGETRKVRWKCLVGGAGKWKRGMNLKKNAVDENGSEIVLEAAIAERLNDTFVIEFSWQPGELSFAEMLHKTGAIPLPPYLHRDAEEEDKSRYQTIYAKHDGSVAAPTAGLHFTERVFGNLRAKNIATEFVTLHVGAGTFKPVKSETMDEHLMHAEFIDVSKAAVLHILAHIGKPIVTVGTTSLRTLESLYWLGVKTIMNPGAAMDEISIHQWDPYEIERQEISPRLALQSLVSWMNANNQTRLITKTQILIAPGYTLRVANGLVTNFHQPQSTLLLLVAAIIGDHWKDVYQYAMDHEFRFLSYGDGCLLWRNSLTQ